MACCSAVRWADSTEIVLVEMMADSKVELWGDRLAEGSVAVMVGSRAVKIWKQGIINSNLH